MLWLLEHIGYIRLLGCCCLGLAGSGGGCLGTRQDLGLTLGGGALTLSQDSLESGENLAESFLLLAFGRRGGASLCWRVHVEGW